MPEITIVPTTPRWLAGARAAIEVKTAGGTPLWQMIEASGPEFAAGFKTRWSDIHFLDGAQFATFLALSNA